MKYETIIKENALLTALRKVVKISLLAAAIFTAAVAHSFAQAPSAELPKVFSSAMAFVSSMLGAGTPAFLSASVA